MIVFQPLWAGHIASHLPAVRQSDILNLYPLSTWTGLEGAERYSESLSPVNLDDLGGAEILNLPPPRKP